MRRQFFAGAAMTEQGKDEKVRSPGTGRRPGEGPAGGKVGSGAPGAGSVGARADGPLLWEV